MAALSAEYITYRKPLTSIRLPELGDNVLIAEVGLKYNFPFAIIAEKGKEGGELLGHSSFVTHPGANDLLQVDGSLLELRMLKVFPTYFGMGLGTRLLDHSKALAIERGKTLILKPERPGELKDKTIRTLEYPLATPELRAFYLRHGFREFTFEEKKKYVDALNSSQFTFSLWCQGFDPVTREFSAGKRYSMSREEAATCKVVPLEEKERLVTPFINLEQWKRLSCNKVDVHLIQAK